MHLTHRVLLNLPRPKLQDDRNRLAENGFSLSEILIALLASSLFFLVTLQSTLISSRYQTLALQKSVFNRWIQSDLEAIQALGRQLHLARLTTPASSGQNMLQVNAGSRLTVADWVVLMTDFTPARAPSSPTLNAPPRVYRIAHIQANTLTLTAPLHQTYTLPTTVIQAATPQTQLTGDSPLHSLQLQLADTTAFPPQSHLVIADDPQIYRIVRRTPSVVYLRPDLKRAQPAGTPVGSFTCQAATLSTGLAAALLSQVVGRDGVIGDTQTLTHTDAHGITYDIQRTLGIVNQAPFNLLSVSYVLPSQSQSAAVDSFTTKILPRATLYCP